MVDNHRPILRHFDIYINRVHFRVALIILNRDLNT